MKIFAISDFHLAIGVDKPMDIFGDNWIGHWEKICSYWKENITDNDIILTAGDTSWGMNLSEAIDDLKAVDGLPGKKFLIRGNHDYWWAGYSKLQALNLNSIFFIQNNAFKAGDFIICGTRGWTVPETDGESSDKKIFEREKMRLKLTLDAAMQLRKNDEKILLMTHYPPFNSRFEDSDFTEIIARYPVDKIIYGHLHGNRSRYSATVVKAGKEYFLTSCDFLCFKPLRIY